MLSPEQGAGPLLGQRLDLVDELTAAVVALPRGPLGVLVGEPRAHRLQDGGAGHVLRGNQLQGVLLAIQLRLQK